MEDGSAGSVCLSGSPHVDLRLSAPHQQAPLMCVWEPMRVRNCNLEIRLQIKLSEQESRQLVFQDCIHSIRKQEDDVLKKWQVSIYMCIMEDYAVSLLNSKATL